LGGGVRKNWRLHSPGGGSAGQENVIGGKRGNFLPEKEERLYFVEHLSKLSGRRKVIPLGKRGRRPGRKTQVLKSARRGNDHVFLKEKGKEPPYRGNWPTEGGPS